MFWSNEIPSETNGIYVIEFANGYKSVATWDGKYFTYIGNFHSVVCEVEPKNLIRWIKLPN